MFISRLKQVYSYIFYKYDDSNNAEVKDILSKYEFSLFLKMSNYDKIHSYNLLQLVKKNKLLSNKKIYLKLALLHDSGKGNISIFRRIKKVLIGDKLLEKHPNNAFENLKEHNLELAELCKKHHFKNVDKYMKEFQKLDNK